jgi:hypothetical protein
MQIVSDKICSENFSISNIFVIENPAVDEIIWKQVVERGRLQMAIWCMGFVCWITKAKTKHPDFVIIIAVRLHQWYNERTSMLRYTYIGCIDVAVILRYIVGC